MSADDLVQIIWLVLLVGLVIAFFGGDHFARVCGSLLIFAALAAAVFLHVRGGPTP